MVLVMPPPVTWYLLLYKVSCGSLCVSNTLIVYPLPLVRPDPVSNLQNTTQTTTTISLIWALGFDGRESIDSVTVTYAAVSNNVSASEGSVPLGASATAHTLTGLQPLTNYNVSVIATNNVGSSIPESITVETDPVGEWQLLHFLLCTLCTVPDQPTNVVVTPLSSTQLRRHMDGMCVYTTTVQLQIRRFLLSDSNAEHIHSNSISNVQSRVQHIQRFLQCCTNEDCTSLCYHIRHNK